MGDVTENERAIYRKAAETLGWDTETVERVMSARLRVGKTEDLVKKGHIVPDS